MNVHGGNRDYIFLSFHNSDEEIPKYLSTRFACIRSKDLNFSALFLFVYIFGVCNRERVNKNQNRQFRVRVHVVG